MAVNFFRVAFGMLLEASSAEDCPARCAVSSAPHAGSFARSYRVASSKAGGKTEHSQDFLPEIASAFFGGSEAHAAREQPTLAKTNPIEYSKVLSPLERECLQK